MNHDPETDGGPMRFKSPWRWFGILCGLGFMCISVGGFSYGEDTGAIFVAIGLLMFGAWFTAFMYLNTIVVRSNHVAIPWGGLWRRKLFWPSISGPELAEADHYWTTIRFPVIFLDSEKVELRQLAWFTIRNDRIPKRVARFQYIEAITCHSLAGSATKETVLAEHPRGRISRS